MRRAETKGASSVRCTGPMAWLAVLILLGTARAGEGPYIVGSHDDPNQVDDVEATLLDVIRIRQHQYTERFAVERVVASPDGREIAAVTRASRQGPQAWDVASGRTVPLPPMSTAVNALAYEPGMRWVAASIQADVLDDAAVSGLLLFDLDTGKTRVVLQGGDRARDVAVSPDGSVVVAATGDGLLAWDTKGGPARRLLDHRSGVDCVAFSSAETVSAVVDAGAGVIQVSLRDGRVIERFDAKPGRGAVAVSPDGRYVVVDDAQGLLIQDVWSRGATQLVKLTSQVSSLDWSADGAVLVAGTSDGLVIPFEVHGAKGLATSGASTPLIDRKESTDDEAEIALRPRTEPEDPKNPFAALGGEGSEQVEAKFKVLVLSRFGGDPRDGGKMEAALNDNLKRLESCWKREARKGNPSRGKMVFAMGVSANGEGRSVEKPDPDGVGNDKISACLQERLKEPLFPAGLGDLEIELHIDLVPVP
jgi:WD40 repeat protein